MYCGLCSCVFIYEGKLNERYREHCLLSLKLFCKFKIILKLKVYFKNATRLGVVEHACNPSSKAG
jgi:hypothetical protein